MKLFPVGHTAFKEAVAMVKGNSRQVIMVQSPDQNLFDQAIFILKDNATVQKGVTDDALLREAKRLLQNPREKKASLNPAWCFAWAAGGGAAVGLCWLLSAIL